MAARSSVTPSSLADLISQVETALVTAGWTVVVAGTPNILGCVADADGCRTYMSLKDNGAGNIEMTVSPLLNDAGTDHHTYEVLIRETTYSGSAWHLYCYTDFFMLRRGTAVNNYHLFAGLYKPIPGAFYTGYRYRTVFGGTHNSAFTLLNLRWTLYGRNASGKYRFSGPAGSSAAGSFVVMASCKMSATGTYVNLAVGNDLAGGLKFCLPGIIISSEANDVVPGKNGIIGYISHLITVISGPALNASDTVTIDTVQYELNPDKVQYWDYYVDLFLLWEV